MNDKEDLWIRIIDGCILIAGLLILLSIITWAQARDEEDRVADKQNYAAMLASCMNGEALFDYNTDTAYFCSKPLEVKL